MSTLRLSIQSPDLGAAICPVTIPPEGARIGASPDCELRLPGTGVPPLFGVVRAVVASDGRQTWRLVSGDGSTEARDLADGDVLQIGEHRATVRLLDERTVGGSSPGLSGDRLAERLRCAPARPLPARRPLDGGGSGLAVSDPGRLVVLNGPLAGGALPALRLGGRLTIGRSRRCDVAFPDPRMSRRHAMVGRDRRGTWIRDLGGVGGVLVGGRPVGRLVRSRVRCGDLIDIGGLRFEVRPNGGGHETLQGSSRAGSPAPASRWTVDDPVGLALGVVCIAVGIAMLIGGLAGG